MVRKLLGTIFNGFSAIYFSWLGLIVSVTVMVVVMVMVRDRVGQLHHLVDFRAIIQGRPPKLALLQMTAGESYFYVTS